MRTSKKHYVYLCGNISDNTETYQWRIDFRKEVEKRRTLNKSLCILDPTANQFNQDISPLTTITKDKKTFLERALLKKPGVLPRKDYQMIKICTILVVNLIHITENKPLIGSPIECEWARQLMIPVIAIVDESKPLCKLYSRHPFMNDCISERVDTVIEAVDMIEDYFVLI